MHVLAYTQIYTARLVGYLTGACQTYFHVCTIIIVLSVGSEPDT